MTQDTTDTTPALAGRRILLVEDEALVAMLLEDMIGDLGGSVVATASRVDAALTIIDERLDEIDAALLDVNLGSENAFPIAQALDARGKPFAFSTGYGHAGLPEEWRHCLAVQKPFTQEQIEAVLTRIMTTPD